MITLTDKTFDKHINGSAVPILVEFWASWCPPCKMMEPLLSELASEYNECIVIAKINTDQNPQISQHYSIMGVPAFMMFHNNNHSQPIVGAQSKKKLQTLIETVLS